jgi:small-conductance mechanosensitive channel
VTGTWSEFWYALATAAAVAVAVALIATLLVHLLSRRFAPARALARSVRKPFRTLVGVLAVDAALRVTPKGTAGWWPVVEHATRIALILATAWMVAAVAVFLLDLNLSRHRIDVPDNRDARRLRTQVLIIRRLIQSLVVVIAFGATLLTFPAVQAVGTSLLASAGVLSVVAGLAAQSTLANLFAGLQIAFSDALRIDDAVIVENEWGRVEEITLTYVVVRIWDDRRLILPSTYFSSTPFQNWTRRTSELLGAVELDVDWRVDTARMRAELERALAENELWDGRVNVLQVTEAVGGWVRVRILVTAQDAPTLWDLRCQVREAMVAWVRRENQEALPVRRLELVGSEPRETAAGSGADQAGLFTGDHESQATRAGGRGSR